jgi:hypothetical protein
MNEERISELLLEATSPECTDVRMQEIAQQLQDVRALALELLGNLRSRYNDIWAGIKTPQDEIIEASVQNTQCHRLESMIDGKEPIPRLTINELKAMR